MENTALQYWVITTIVLFFKMHANSVAQGMYTVAKGRYARPEDAAFFGRGKGEVTELHPVADRATRCWRNDLENIPLFLFLALAFALLGGPAQCAAWYYGVYTFARIMHTVFYLKLLQPHRFLSYQLGQLATVAMIVHLVVLLRG